MAKNGLKRLGLYEMNCEEHVKEDCWNKKIMKHSSSSKEVDQNQPSAPN